MAPVQAVSQDIMSKMEHVSKTMITVLNMDILTILEDGGPHGLRTVRKFVNAVIQITI